MSDALLLPAAVTLEGIYRAEFGFVWRNARALGVPQGAVDDVVQEIFMVAHRRLAEFQQRSSVRTWLWGILVNVVRGYRRTQRRRSPHELARDTPTDVDSLATDAEGPHDITLAHEATALLERILDDLDEKKREIFVLAELEELSGREIGEILGLSVNTVSSRLRLARDDFERAAARYRAREHRRLP